jgi:hypothetical protein
MKKLIKDFIDTLKDVRFQKKRLNQLISAKMDTGYLVGLMKLADMNDKRLEVTLKDGTRFCFYDPLDKMTQIKKHEHEQEAAVITGRYSEPGSVTFR